MLNTSKQLLSVRVSAQACSCVTNRAMSPGNSTLTLQPQGALKIVITAGSTPTARRTNPPPTALGRPVRARLLAPAAAAVRGRQPGATAPNSRDRPAAQPVTGPPRFPLPSRRRLPPGRRAAPPAGPSPPPPRRGSWYRDGPRGERVLAQVGTRRLPGRSSGAGGGCFPATLISSHAASVVLSDGRLGGTRRLRHRPTPKRPLLPAAPPSRLHGAGLLRALPRRPWPRRGGGTGRAGGGWDVGLARGLEPGGERKAAKSHWLFNFALFQGDGATVLAPSPLRPHPDSELWVLLRALPRSSPVPHGSPRAARGKEGRVWAPASRILPPRRAVGRGRFCEGKVGEAAGGCGE